MAYTVLIVDDSAVVRHSLRDYLEPHPDLRVCGEAENGQVAVEKVRELGPDVVILDLMMPVMNGLEAARQISRIAPKTVMLMFTMYSCEPLLKDAQQAGIKDVLSKSGSVAERLMSSLRSVCADLGSSPA